MEYKTASVRVSTTMDYLGYSHDMVKIRQQSCAVFTEILETPFGQSMTVYTGSKAEGLTAPYESDIDKMIVPSHIICTTDPTRQRRRRYRGISVFYMLDREAAAPGYTRLLYDGKFRFSELTEHDQSVMVDISGNHYLSSAKVKKANKLLHEGQHDYGIDGSITHVYTGEQHGPSLTSKFLLINMELDNVTAYMCECPDMLESWISRERRHDWPTATVIKEIASMEAYVAPVGYKKSAFESLEWRICFTTAEIKLIRSLNGFQIKLLVLLKIIAKQVLKPLCQEITSYVMKNLVLWLIEMFPSGIFIEENLISLLKGALLFLKICLSNNALPSYMIMKRNLFVDRVTCYEKSKLCEKIDELQKEGPDVVLRCERIGIALSSSPDVLYRKSLRRHELEMLLIQGIYNTTTNKENSSNPVSAQSLSKSLNKLTNGNPEMLYEICHEFEQTQNVHVYKIMLMFIV